VAFGPFLAALTFSDDAILLEELIGSLGGRLARLLLGAKLALLAAD
jgi:hypothetical protein